MLTVHSPAVIEPDPQYGWEIIFWLGDSFDYQTPFREALATLVEILQRSGPAAVELPAYTPDEDFVEGRLTWGYVTLNVYYEYSLGYLALMTSSREALENIAARVLPFVRVQ